MSKIPDLGPAGTRLKVVNPDVRVFVIEVLKASIVYRELLSGEENDYMAKRRWDYATFSNDMVVMNDDMTRLAWIAQKLNLTKP
jgi:hypothetical protein